jgi:hypothetical protein
MWTCPQRPSPSVHSRRRSNRPSSAERVSTCGCCGRPSAVKTNGTTRKTRLHRFGTHGGHARLSRFGQKHRHIDFSAYRFGDGLQRGRLFRPLPEVFRFRRPADYRKGKGDTVVLIDGIEEKVEILEDPRTARKMHTPCPMRSPITLQRKEKSQYPWFPPDRVRPTPSSAASIFPGTTTPANGCATNRPAAGAWDRVCRQGHQGRGGPLGTGVPKIQQSGRPGGPENRGQCHSKEIVALDPKQNEMARIGTTHLVPIMNDFDLLPTNNFQYGPTRHASLIGKDAYWKLFDPGFDGCWMGCTVACAHGVKDFVPLTGPYKGRRCSWTGPSMKPLPAAAPTWDFRPLHHSGDQLLLRCLRPGYHQRGHRPSPLSWSASSGVDQPGHTGGMDLSFGNRLNALELVHQMAGGRASAPSSGRASAA